MAKDTKVSTNAEWYGHLSDDKDRIIVYNTMEDHIEALREELRALADEITKVKAQMKLRTKKDDTKHEHVE